jgi:type 1 glutamine amidotransferase
VTFEIAYANRLTEPRRRVKVIIGPLADDLIPTDLERKRLMKTLGFLLAGRSARAICSVAPWSLSLLTGLLICVAGPRGARAADDGQPIRALLVSGGAFHDYAHQKGIVTKGISERVNVLWTVAYDTVPKRDHKNPLFESPDWAKGFDVIVYDECKGGVTDLEWIRRILKPHRDGLPAVVLHSAMHAYRSEGWPEAITPWFEFTGLQTTGHGRQAPIAIRFVDETSPITKGLENWTTIPEELYNNAAGQLLSTAHVLARGKQTLKDKNGKEVTSDNVVAWTNIYNGKTRVFATTIGHNNETVADPRYLDLVARGLLWSVDKLDDAHLKPVKKVPSEAQSKP